MMLAELSVFPLEKGAEGLSHWVAQSIKIIQESGLDYEVHAMGSYCQNK
jgi:uncharacterized protein YqgV (UPF0045/DUF77 family)